MWSESHPALPGAQLQEIEGDEYRGIVKVKVGPITAQYKGKATFVEKDDANHKAVLKAEGRDTKGQGNASALITATLDARRHEARRSRCTPTSRSRARWRSSAAASMADVSTKLLEPVRRAARDHRPRRRRRATAAKPDAPVAMAAAEPEPAAAPKASDARPRSGALDHPEAEPVDLMDAAGASVAEAGRSARHRRASAVAVRARPAPPTSQLGGRRHGRGRRRSSPSSSDRALLAVRGGGTRRAWTTDRDPQRAAARRRHADADALLARRQGRESKP